MRLFGRKAARGAVRPVLARGWQGAATGLGEWPRSYEAQVRDAYLGNAVAQRAVRLVAEGVASLVVTGEAAAVRLVSAESGGQGLLETLAAHLLLHGNGYVEVAIDAGGRPGELFALRPERVSVEADASGWPAAYLYRVGDRAARFVPAEARAAGAEPDARDRVIHLKRFHPLDDHYGLGCLGAAAGAVKFGQRLGA